MSELPLQGQDAGSDRRRREVRRSPDRVADASEMAIAVWDLTPNWLFCDVWPQANP
jgi:hypothetical protein